jgi:hypothetical protein
MAESMGGNAFRQFGFPDRCSDGLLNMGFVKMISSLLLQFFNIGQGFCREKPQLNELFGSILVFLF